MTERDRVRFGSSAIEYEIRRSERRRKTVQISVDGNGVQVAAPAGIPGDEIRAIVGRRAPWILSQAPAATMQAAPKRFVSGETLPYLGRNVRLVVEPADVGLPVVRFDHWRFHVAVPRRLDGDERGGAIRRALTAWYRTRAAERLRSGLKRWWPHFGAGRPPPVLIRDQRQRWASCAPDGTLRFNWRIVMAGPALVDYVIVHELAHLQVREHSAAFWSAVARPLPDYRERRARLREAGPWLTL